MLAVGAAEVSGANLPKLKRGTIAEKCDFQSTIEDILQVGCIERWFEHDQVAKWSAQHHLYSS